MKKSITLTFIAFLCLTVFGQSPKKTLRDKKLTGLSNFQKQPMGIKNAYILTASSVTPQRLDSVVIPDGWKEYYFYDNAQNIAEYIYSDWNGSKWVNVEKTTYTYEDNNNQPILDYRYTWNSTDNKWDARRKYEYKYNAKNNITEKLSYKWDNVLQWTNNYKQISSYNTTGDTLLSIQYFDWDDVGVKWNQYRNEVNYFHNNLLDSTIVYEYFNGTWSNNIKDVFTYYKNGKPEGSMHFQWLGSSIWSYIDKYHYTYNANEDIAESITYGWNINIDDWVNYGKETFEYDTEKNLTTYIDSIWDSEGTKWVGNEKEIYAYDNSFTRNNIILPFYFNEGDYDSLTYRHKLLNFDAYEYEGNDWIKKYQYLHYYSVINTTGKSSLTGKLKVNIFPNPASESESVNFAIDNATGQIQIALYDSQGKLVLSSKYDNNKALDIKKLPRGIYYYKVSDSKNEYKGKLVKE